MIKLYVPNRRILLPKALDKRLKDLSRLEQETSGTLLYVTQEVGSGLDLRVDTLYMSGVGGRGFVGAEPERQRVINDFLSHHPEYGFIDWHTHISGSALASPEDMTRFGWYSERYPFTIMMITPRNKPHIAIQSESGGNLRNVVVPTPDDFYSRESYLLGELRKSEKRLGLSHIPWLKATRKRH